MRKKNEEIRMSGWKGKTQKRSLTTAATTTKIAIASTKYPSYFSSTCLSQS